MLIFILIKINRRNNKNENQKEAQRRTLLRRKLNALKAFESYHTNSQADTQILKVLIDWEKNAKQSLNDIVHETPLQF